MVTQKRKDEIELVVLLVLVVITIGICATAGWHLVKLHKLY